MANYQKIKRYRGGFRNRKRKRQRILKIILFVLIFIVFVFVGYSVARSIARLNDPANQSSSQPSESSALPSESSSSDSSIQSSSEFSESSVPVTEIIEIRSILLPAKNMFSLESAEAFLKIIDKNLYNSVTVELKNQKGQIFYPTESALAKSCDAISKTTIDIEKLAALIEKYGFHPVARIYTLQDDYASHASFGTSYLYNNQVETTWLDNSPAAGGRSWLNPYMEKAVAYLEEITNEIAKSGFKTIVAAGLQYPNTSNQQGMGLGATAKNISTKDALIGVYDAMKSTAAKYSATIIPAYLGECYLGKRPQIYTANPNEFLAIPASPILGNDLSLLSAVTTPLKDLIPTISSAEQIPSLREKGILQYFVG